MELKETIKQVKPCIYKKVVEEEPSYFIGKKGQWRYQIHKEVFDLYDSVADNAKMISLLFTLLSRIWDALPDDIKSNISDEDRQIIEYAFEKFHNIKTRADIQFQEEGTKLIDKLMDRQAKIGEIVSS
jgi:hypothetical protein